MLKPFRCVSDQCRKQEAHARLQYLPFRMDATDDGLRRVPIEPCEDCGTYELNPLCVVHLLVKAEGKGRVPKGLAKHDWNFACEAAQSSPVPPSFYSVDPSCVTCYECSQSAQAQANVQKSQLLE